MLKMVGFILLASATPALAESGNVTQIGQVDAAYDQLAKGQTLQAIVRLRDAERDASADPARLINLGTAYAKVGRFADAARVYRAAAASRERYDIELADGSYMDSRAAAKLALRKLSEMATGPQMAVIR